MAEAKVGILIEAQDNASRTLGNVTAKMKELEPVFKKAAVAGTAVFAAIATEGVLSLKAYSEAQKQMTIATTALENSLKGMNASQLENATGFIDQAGALGEVTAWMEKASKAALQLGFDDETAAVSFAKFFQISKDGAQAQKDLSLAMDLAAFSGKSLEETSSALTKAYAGGARILKEFGVEIEDGATKADVFRIANERAGGAASKMAGTVAGQTEIMRLQFENLQESIGQALVPALTKFLTAVTPIIVKLGEWAEKNPTLIVTIGGVVAATFALIGAVGILGLAFTGLIPIATALGISVLATFGWMLAIPAIIGAIIYAGVYLYQHWEQIEQKAAELMKALGEAWDGIVAMVTEAWMSVRNTIMSYFGAAKEYILGVLEVLKEAWEFTWLFLTEFAKNLLGLWVGSIITLLDFLIPNWREKLQFLYDWAVYIFTMLFGFWQYIFIAIRDFVMMVWSAIVDWLSNKMLEMYNTAIARFTLLKDGIVAVLNILKPVWEAIWGGIQAYFSGVWESITSKLQAAVDFIERQLSRIQSAIGAVTGAASKVGGGVQNAFQSVMNTGKSALKINDGIVQNGKIITTHPDDFIIATKTPQSLGGGRDINININGAIFSEEAARTLGDILYRQLNAQIRI